MRAGPSQLKPSPLGGAAKLLLIAILRATALGEAVNLAYPV
jgi:hypothetical protein